ncbi:MAG: hypothetical protein IPL65_18260 [Lewinellaceae bacterium]|nr:hypothetical protein [Lewinellaceae bacterium]
MLTKLLYRHYLWLLFPIVLLLSFSRTHACLRGVIWSDAEGYYKYLPTVFILGDVHKMPAGSVWPLQNEKGEYLDKYTCGVAYFELPFFLLTKQILAATGQDSSDVFSDAYARSVVVSGVVACFIGLFFLQRALRTKYREPVVFLALMMVFLGTNLFHYASKEMGMSHVYSFALMSFLVWQTPGFYRNPNLVNSLLLGGGLGWLVLIRPTNLIIVLFIGLYSVYSRRDLLERLVFARRHLLLLLPAGLAAIVSWLPQIWYWHEMAGSWFRYSYTNEGFIYWNKPKMLAVLFDPQNGLFLYSPLVLLLLAVVIGDFRKKQHNAPAILLVFLVCTYCFASWWAWWFGGAFGARSYVEWYALLAFPAAGFVERRLVQARGWSKWLAWLVLLFLVYYSVRMSFLYNSLPGPWDGADWRWNFSKMTWIWQHLFCGA